MAVQRPLTVLAMPLGRSVTSFFSSFKVHVLGAMTFVALQKHVKSNDSILFFGSTSILFDNFDISKPMKFAVVELWTYGLALDGLRRSVPF